MARVGAPILLIAALGVVACAHGQPSDTASNIDAGVELDGEADLDGSTPKDGPATDSPAPDGPPSDGPHPEAAPDGPAEAAPCAAMLVINEVQTAGAASADDEYVELYNAASCTITLDGYMLLYRSSDGVSDLLVWTAVPGQTMASGQFFVIGGKDYPSAPDYQFPAQVALGGDGGGLGLLKDDDLVDSVAWGDATNIYVESSAAPAPQAGKSIGRLPDGKDTDNNSVDFKEATATPRKSNSPL